MYIKKRTWKDKNIFTNNFKDTSSLAIHFQHGAKATNDKTFTLKGDQTINIRHQNSVQNVSKIFMPPLLERVKMREVMKIFR